MREILFRGKRVDNGEWVYGAYYGLCRMTNKAGDFGYAHLMRQSNDEPLYRVDPETVGQFTGMYDRNGKKIFEGDIIAFRSSESIYEVAYDITDAKFIILLRNGKDSFLRFYNISAYYFSVIANKWDNPELLEMEE